MALSSKEMQVVRYQVGNVIAGKYRLDALLGEGGMGAVWGAFNLQLEAPVAIKVLLNTGRDHELLNQRLRQEARATAKLGHPSIVRVFDVGESEFGDPFIVMELLRGKSLATSLSEDGPHPPTRAVQLLLPIADALSLAHLRGIIHRDLKPDNVFICTNDDQIEPKLVDFGIVKIAGPTSEATHLTQVGTVVGSPDYMSPEQARGLDDVDARSDIWSFCVMLYEAIAGVTPFTGTNYNALLVSILTDEPRPLAVHSEADAALWRILQCGLNKDRAARFQSMAELGRALAVWLTQQGILQDVCGGSLEAKWISRPSDPSALNPARASLPSIPTQPPESGVRPAQTDLGTARTHAAPSLSAPSQAVAAIPPQTRKRLSPTVLGLGLGIVLGAAGSLLWLATRGAAPATLDAPESRPRIDPAPSATPVTELEASPVQDAVTVEPVPTGAAEAKPRPPAPRTRPNNPEKPPASDLLAPY